MELKLSQFHTVTDDGRSERLALNTFYLSSLKRGREAQTKTGGTDPMGNVFLGT